jgi:HAD superfamily hydrolase (TIGR01544 family)
MKNNIIYSNKNNFLKILENIKKDWAENLHILADFDKTLTKASLNWEKRHALISVLEKQWYLWEEYSKKYREYFEFYHKFEISLELSKEEKSIKMEEWWGNVNELLIKNKLNRNDIKKIISDWITNFREGVCFFLDNLSVQKIPTIIISANWLGWDAIELFFEHNNVDFENIDIISNKFIWDENWTAIWYEKPVIHVFNKDETVLENFPEIIKKIENRKNVILLWDSLWDPHMVDWFEYKNLIKIWFLNEITRIEEKKDLELLKAYKEKYDIIITWDWNFDVVNEIMKEIFEK